MFKDVRLLTIVHLNMFDDKTTPSELAFWKNRLADRSLLSAIGMYPAEARKIFGPVPVMRKDILQLGLILTARQVLIDPEDVLDKNLWAAIEALPEKERLTCRNAVSPARHRELVKNWAKAVIKEATGNEP